MAIVSYERILQFGSRKDEKYSQRTRPRSIETRQIKTNWSVRIITRDSRLLRQRGDSL